MKKSKYKNIFFILLLFIAISLCCYLTSTLLVNKTKKVKENALTTTTTTSFANSTEQTTKTTTTTIVPTTKNIKTTTSNIKITSHNVDSIPIFTLHRTTDHNTKITYYSTDEWVNDIEVVDTELKWLYDNNWKSIDLDQFYCWYINKCNFTNKVFVLTVDDGDSEAYFNLLPVLKKYNYNATLFAIGKYIPETTAPLNEPKRQKLGLDKIMELRNNKSLLQVESHSYNLHYTDDNNNAIILNKTKEELIEDFNSNNIYNFTYMAYPYGKYSSDILDVIKNTTIKMAFAFNNGRYATRNDDVYRIPRLKVGGNMNLDNFIKLIK